MPKLVQINVGAFAVQVASASLSSGACFLMAANPTFTLTLDGFCGLMKITNPKWGRVMRYYVDSGFGCDQNDGLTPETAWETLKNVNATTFMPGDEILLKKGSFFYTTG